MREIGDLGEALAQLLELRPAHSRETYMRRPAGGADGRTQAGGPEGELRGRPLPPVCRTSSGDGGRGLYPPPCRARTRQRLSMGIQTFVSLEHCKSDDISLQPASMISRSRRWAAAFVIGGRAFAASSRSDADGCRRRSSAISTRCSGRASRSTALIASTCSCAARALRTRFASSAFASRFASRPERGEDGVLLEPQRRVPRSGEGEHVGDRLVTLRVGDGVRPPLGDVAAATSSRAATSARNRAPSSPPARSSRCGSRGPGERARARGARRAGRRRGSTSARRRASAAVRAVRRTGRARRPRAAPRGRARRRRRAAGTASRGRTPAGGRCGSRSGRRGRAGGRTPAARPPSSPGRGARRPSRRAGARRRRRGRAPTARRGGSSAAPARSARARRGGRQRATCFERQQPALVLHAELAPAAEPVRGRRRGARAGTARARSGRRTSRPRARRPGGRRARPARRR